jgi:hypothetical protein
MAETHVLTSPITYAAPASLTEWRVVRFYIDRGTNTPSVLMVARSNTGIEATALYEGSEASTLISQLNTANLSTKSLQKRILEKMAADGFLSAGAVSGTPD